MTIPANLKDRNKGGPRSLVSKLPYTTRFQIFLELKDGAYLEETAKKYGLNRSNLSRYTYSGEFRQFEAESIRMMFHAGALPPEDREHAAEAGTAAEKKAKDRLIAEGRQSGRITDAMLPWAAAQDSKVLRTWLRYAPKIAPGDKDMKTNSKIHKERIRK